MITITWHLLLLIVAALMSFYVAVTRDARPGLVGLSPRGAALFLWVAGVVIVFLIYGGFVWW